MKKLIPYYQRLFFDHKNWLLVAVGWFILGAFLGAAVYTLWPDQVLDFIKRLAKKYAHTPPDGFPAAMWLFRHNFLSAALCMLLGGVAGLAPVFELVVNGFAISCVSVLSLLGGHHSFGFGLPFLMAAILPHGIIEIPTTILASAIGLKIGWAWLSPQAEGKRLQVLKTSFTAGLYACPGIASLLFVAALIEAFVTPYLSHLVIGASPLQVVP
jgi:stage II sporulation protein M